MSIYSDIYGQKNLIEHFKKSVREDKISGAYIISGEKLSGKKMLAKRFATSIQCENPVDGEACMECHACRMSLSNNNPDIKYVVPSKEGKAVSVDDIREQVNGDIDIKPYYCKKKIYIIDNAQELNQQSQNALLKTIEEPPSYGVVILLTSNEGALLQTILSRGVKLSTRAVPKDEIKNYLMEHAQIPDYAAEGYALYANGNLGKAIEMSKTDDYDRLKDLVIRLFSDENANMAQGEKIIADIADIKDNLDDFFDICLMWMRDVLALKSGCAKERLIFKGDYDKIKNCAGRCSYIGIDQIIKSVDEAKAQLELNVRFEMVFRAFLMTVRNNMKYL